MTVRVLLVDDHAMMRAGLASVLGSDPEIEVVGEAGDGAAAVSQARRLTPDVVLMDVEMPGVDGVTAIGQLARVAPSARCLVLTTFDVDDYVLGALRAGAAGFLLKTTPPRDLIRAVKDCAAGGSALGPTVVRRLVASYVGVEGAPEAAAELERLTERERDVLGVMARGLSNAEIGAELFLTENTVRTHVAHILAKLGVRDRVQAVILAHRAGLV
ncbi:response regulator [Nostocoides sp. F2B08]|uniref:response regulator n=1 Tax=Nostocoides sp. F2B08 TaxID=2653936 RepID=UPI001263CF13|nr:response regulator transcription factor [Tetrasphaera sp. F2B08]KAB7744124.1 response regulator [Tetrasphaera sp. F2B08]